jgi:hypothetical protein
LLIVASYVVGTVLVVLAQLTVYYTL